MLAAVCAAQVSEDNETYESITTSVDFNYKPEYVDMGYEKHDLFEDIKVSVVEGAAIGFFYSLFYVYFSKAIDQKTMSPEGGTIEDNKATYFYITGAFAAINTLFNVFFFYDYDNKEPDK